MTDEQPTKVLHILKNMQKGGVERFILNQYSILSTQYVDFDIALYGPDKNRNDEEFIKEFESLGGKIIYLPFPNSRFLSFATRFSSTLKNNKYDAIHSHQNLFSGIILLIAKLNGVPIRIAHAHTSKERKRNNIVRTMYTDIMKNLISFSATHFLCASSLAAQYVFKSTTISEFLPNGVNIQPFLEKSKADIKSELKISNGEMVVGHVGSFKPAKNHDFIIKIFSDYQKKHPKTHLILVGDGTEMTNIKRKVDNHNLNDKVHFLGNRSDIPDLMKMFDVFLFPSHFEGLGISLIESQASGVKSIASSSVPRETDIGLNLISFLPLDKPDEWLSEMEKILLTKYSSPTAEIREKTLIAKKFDNTSSANRLLEIYTANNRK